MKLRGLLLAAAFAVAPPVYADGDSSADASAGFVQELNESEGLMVSVPVNENGDELVAAAETRLVKESVSTSTDFATAFTAGEPVNTDAGISDFDVNADSSTSGWYYGSRSRYSSHRYYRTSGSYYPGYYRTYRPSYYSHGYRYSYHQPVYRTYYGRSYHNPHGGYYGHRYYYYGRGW